MLVIERLADPIVSLPRDAFRKREPVQLRSVITGKIGSPVTIRQTQVSIASLKCISRPASVPRSRLTVPRAALLQTAPANRPAGCAVFPRLENHE